MYEAHSAATAASSTSAALAGSSASVPQAAGSSKIILDVSTESWASDILNQSQEMSESSPLRSGVICRTSFSTPRRAIQNADGLNDTFSTVNLSPIPNVSARAVQDLVSAVRVQPPPIVAPVLSAAVPVLPVAVPSPIRAAVPAPSRAASAATAAIPPAAGGDAPQRKRRCEDAAVVPPPVQARNADAVLDMTREKSRLDRLVSAEIIRLMRISHRATVQAAHQ